MNKRKRVAIQKHRATQRKIEAKKAATTAANQSVGWQKPEEKPRAPRRRTKPAEGE